jgi:hypothetical protein
MPRVATINDPTQPITETSPTPRILLQSAVLAHPTIDWTSARLGRPRGVVIVLMA